MYTEAKRLHEQGMSLRAIAEQLGCDRKKLSQALKRDGVVIKSRGMNKGTQKYKHNTDVFKVIDTEEKAYWLGFLYADGSIYEPRGTVELSLGAKDKEHLEKFRNFISPDLPIKEKDVRLKGNVYKACRLQLVSMEITRDLIKLGCPPAKSLTLKFPTEDIVPKHLIHHFMRGYFDGDGTAGCYTNQNHPHPSNDMRFSVLGTEEFLLGFYNELKHTGLPLNKFQEHGKAKGIGWGGNGRYELFSDFLYKDAHIYLERKFYL